jgi:hypothetical protein
MLPYIPPPPRWWRSWTAAGHSADELIIHAERAADYDGLAVGAFLCSCHPATTVYDFISEISEINCFFWLCAGCMLSPVRFAPSLLSIGLTHFFAYTSIFRNLLHLCRLGYQQ